AANANDIAGLVDSITAPDASTVVFKLKEPTVVFFQRLADDYNWPIMPPETGTAFDPTKTLVGAGPYMVDKLDPPNGWTVKKFPDWHGGPKPYIQQLETVVIANPATSLTQFKAGNLDRLTNSSAEQILDAKSTVKDAQIGVSRGPSCQLLTFSAKD